jgi:penicillin G amidase
MKTLKRTLLIIFAMVVVILIAAFIFIKDIARSGLPDYSEDISIAGLTDKVTVYRDSFAIPHIYAVNEHDLYMAVGYLSAQDRLWQMDFLRRVTLGKLSEIFGDDFLETDLLLRSLRFSEKSESLVKNTDPEVLQALTAYAEGVNAYIKDNQGNYPFEFRVLGYKPDPWDIVHSLNLIGYMAWDLKSGWSELLLEQLAGKVDSIRFREILPDPENQKTYTYNSDEAGLLAANKLLQLSGIEDMGVDIFSGSNNWAVTGSKTNSGSPILANDMHLAFNIPGIWMQMHEVVEGRLDVTGLVLPGQPLVVVGHNDSIAWGMTNTYVDNLDFYVEEIHPDDSTKYRYKGEWKDFEIREEIIRSKDGTEHALSYMLNHRGPVVSSIKDVKDKVLTMHWVGDEPSNEMRSIYMVNHADNWEDFKDAFRTFISISQNIVYADKKGNIGLYCCAGVPVRKRDKVFAVLPGNTDEYDWKGMVPFDELPNEYNPARGFVSSANCRTTDSRYPHHIGTWFDLPYRMDRIREMLSEREIFSVNDFKIMQNDQHSVYSELFLASILPALSAAQDFNETELSALQMLKNWDCALGKNSVEATISEFLWYRILVNTYADELGTELFDKFSETGMLSRLALHKLFLASGSAWLDNISTEETESFRDIVVTSFKETIAGLVNDRGGDISKWEWGSIHTLTLNHPLSKVKVLNTVFKLNRGPYAAGGSFHTVSPYKFPLFKPDGVNHGSSHRNIFDLKEWDNCLSVIPTGVSGMPASRHYCDQTELYINGRYHSDFFSEKKVKENVRYKMVFKP